MNGTQDLKVLDMSISTAQAQTTANFSVKLMFTVSVPEAEFSEDNDLDATLEVIALAVEDGDPSAAFDKEALTAIRVLKQSNYAEWVRYSKRLKAAKVSLTELNKQVDGGGREDAAADKLIDVARSCCTFFQDDQLQLYASFESGSARQVYPLDSRGFQAFLAHRYYIENDRSPSEQALRNALVTLRGDAQFKGEIHRTFIRIAKTDDAYWLDLCDEEWRCVRITSEGWSVHAGDGVPRFTRTPSMQALPMPVGGGNLEELWKLVNIPEQDRLLVLAWLLECLRPETPHVVLELVGEQGSAKSSTQRILRRLIDPNLADLRPAPKAVEDVWVGARNSHLVSHENLSHLSPAFQDALCTLSTGGGYATRTLYTNSEESVISLCRPVVLNGISVIVTAQDLLDRSVHVSLPRIERRFLSSEVENRFEERQPYLLGALLDLMVKVLKVLPTVEIAPEARPRMADFAFLGDAVCQALGGRAGQYAERYAEVRKEGVLRTIDASPVGSALKALLEKQYGNEKFHGTMQELLTLLEGHRGEHKANWPMTPKAMGDALRRLAPAFRTLGYEVVSEEKRGGQLRWRIFLKSQQADPRPENHGSPVGPVDPTVLQQPPETSVGLAGHAGPNLEGLSPEKKPPDVADDEAESF